jgi:hypothetical protein
MLVLRRVIVAKLKRLPGANPTGTLSDLREVYRVDLASARGRHCISQEDPNEINQKCTRAGHSAGRL